MFSDNGARRYFRHATEQGANAPTLNEWVGEAFTFNSVQEFETFKGLHPELFDKDASNRDIAKRWKAFGATTAGQALRTR